MEKEKEKKLLYTGPWLNTHVEDVQGEIDESMSAGRQLVETLPPFAFGRKEKRKE